MLESKPPGVCFDSGVHGPQRPLRRSRFGVGRLRAVLGVSAETGVEQLCEDAAQEIEELRGVETAIDEPGAPIVEKRGRGRPRKHAAQGV